MEKLNNIQDVKVAEQQTESRSKDQKLLQTKLTT